jgi:glucose-6-phosphate 1-dehydrogenase
MFKNRKMSTNEHLQPTIFAIFGGSGDLTWRKLVPSLFDLFQDVSMPSFFSIIALDRIDLTDIELRRRYRDGIEKFSRKGKVSDEDWSGFSRHVYYKKGDFTKQEIYTVLKDQCTLLENEWKEKAQIIFYMATPPVMFGVIPGHLKEAGMTGNHELSRIVIEKPIGYDLESALKLNKTLTASFRESQIFRIDHYLGKETVQNILAFRFANPFFEPVWNRRYVDYVTITVAEDLGVEHRGEYYDKAGALRDMVQNHLMQLLCLVAMEPMISFQADEIRNKKVDVLHAMRPITREMIHKSAVRGQYGSGRPGGMEVSGYRGESGVSAGSFTETFAALKLYVDNWRWQDVPFYLRTGKRLPRQVSEITIQFRAVPHKSFPPEAIPDWQSSSLIISIQPNEGIVLCFQAKQPGTKLLLKPVNLKFNYQESFSTPIPDAYETLLWDVMTNDATLFMRADQVEAAWNILMPVIEEWSADKPLDFPNYEAGSWGPVSADTLFDPGHHWPVPAYLIDKDLK